MPDLPLEETVEIRAACNRAGLELVVLATPTSTKERMSDIAKLSQGFVYLVSVTGARRSAVSRHGGTGFFFAMPCLPAVSAFILFDKGLHVQNQESIATTLSHPPLV